MLYADGKAHFSRKYDLEVIDRVGGGDSFGAGLIRSLIHGNNCQDCIEYAAAFSALKHTIPGDINWTDPEDVEALLKGSGSRIAR